MRLSVFLVDTLSPQLIIDLPKIYMNTLPKQAISEATLQDEISNNFTQRYVSMFNERHIAAVKVQLNATKATLSQLCIRDLTRRRGIGKNMLKEVEAMLITQGVKEISYSLHEAPSTEYLVMRAFFADSGYTTYEYSATKKIQ